MQKYQLSQVKFYPSLDQDAGKEGVTGIYNVIVNICNHKQAIKIFHDPFRGDCLMWKALIQIKKNTLVHGNNSVENLSTEVHHYKRVLW